MTTARDIIERSLRILLVLSDRQTPTASMMEDGLEALNDLCESFSLSQLNIPVFVTDQKAIVAGDSSFTYGTGGALNSERPISINNAYFRVGVIDYSVAVINSEQYASLSNKQTPARTEALFYKTGYPLGTVLLNAPAQQSGTLFMDTQKVFSRFPTAFVDIALPEGYARMLAHNLAIEIAAEYSAEPSVSTIKMANQSRKLLERHNHRLGVMKSDASLLTNDRMFNVLTGR